MSHFSIRPYFSSPRRGALSAPGKLARSLGGGAVVMMLALVLGAPPVRAQSGDDTVLQAREALRKKDRAQLASLSRSLNATSHPLTQWVEYWELNLRLGGAQASEVQAFLSRWSGTYVEDRLRNDWLLEAGRRRDWASVRLEHPRFRMNDDR